MATTEANPSPPIPSASSLGVRRKALKWLLIGLILAGMVGRVTRYGLAFPIWCDEAFICNNMLDRDYIGLTRGLEHSQVAPVLFLWSQRALFLLLGASEWAVRLGPLLAGMTAVLLFWRLARNTLQPLAATVAVGMLAVARWPVTMAVDVKPYSFDLLMALVLLVPAVEWLRRPQRLVWLILLALAAPVALLASYPAVFVAGAVSLALLPTAWRSGWAGRSLFVAYNLLMLAAFGVGYWIVGREQLDPVHGLVNAYLTEYWANGFPPASPWPLARWLLTIHTGRMMAYPVGGDNGLSALTFLLFLVGAWAWWKSGRRWQLLLWLTPFALNFIAAVMRRYPYGGCCRLSQHLAPAVCLLAGLGTATLLEKCVPTEALRRRWVAVVGVLLAACVVGGLICDLVRPYHDPDALWQRTTARAILGQVGPEDAVVIVQDRSAVVPVFRWYMDSGDPAVRWDGRLDPAPDGNKGVLWTVQFWRAPAGAAASPPPPFQAPAKSGWEEAAQKHYVSQPRVPEDATLHCDLSRWVRSEKRE